jgi:hypothetical protein
MPKSQIEYQIQKAFCRYVSTQYPKVLFRSDYMSHLFLKPQQGVRNKTIQKEGYKDPDMAIFEPKGEFHGLFIEFKKESPCYKNKPTELKKDEHVQAQAKTLQQLREKGYKSEFAWSLDMAMEIIDNYMKL